MVGFNGAAFIVESPLTEAELLVTRSKVTGVGGGDMNATFFEFCVSEDVTTLPLVVFREL